MRTLFDHVAVFVGGFELDGAVSMIGEDEYVVLDALDQLIDRSLLIAERKPDTPTRYTLLESLRHYGIDRLTERGNLDQIRDRHLRWLRDLTTRHSAPIQLSERAALHRIDRELANIRGGLDWATHDTARAVIGIDIVLALGRYWYQRGLTPEAASWIQRLRQAGPSLSPDTEAQVLCDLGFALLQAGEATAALEPLDSSLALARHLGDPALVTKVLHYLTRAGLGLRDPDELLALIDEGRALAQLSDDALHGYLHSIIRVIWFIFYADTTQAQQIGWQFVDEYQHHPSPHIAAHVHETGAWLALLTEDAERARDHLIAALTIYQDLDNPGCSCHALETHAWWHAVRGDADRAHHVLHAVLNLREREQHHRARYESVPYIGVTRLLKSTEQRPPPDVLFRDLPSGIKNALTTLRSANSPRRRVNRDPDRDDDQSVRPVHRSVPGEILEANAWPSKGL